MEKAIFEQMGGTCHEENGYLIPNLTLPSEEENPIGIWGHRNLRYLKQNRKLFYINLLTSGRTNSYLAGINEQAEDMFIRLVNQMTLREGLTERLKSYNQMKWVHE